MALFDTPSLLDTIWRKETFPEDGGGLAGLSSGLSSGLKTGSQFNVDKKANDKMPAEKQAEVQKPNAFKYFFGAGGNPVPPPYYGGQGQSQWQPGAFGGATASPMSYGGDIHAAIEGLVSGMAAMGAAAGPAGAVGQAAAMPFTALMGRKPNG